MIRRWRDQRRIRHSRISAQEWAEAFAALPLLSGLSPVERQQLQELVILFLHRKTFEGAQGLVLTQAMALRIALQACLPILHLGLECYDGWYAVIVYPSGFAPKREYTDEAGVVHFE
ncbi:MAG: zinc-dependent peptidase, partial [Gammaproteobacteria bacterium]